MLSFVVAPRCGPSTRHGGPVGPVTKAKPAPFSGPRVGGVDEGTTTLLVAGAASAVATRHSRSSSAQVNGRSHFGKRLTSRRLFGDAGQWNPFSKPPADQTREKLGPMVDKINGLESLYAPQSDADLRESATSLRQRARRGEDLDALLPEAFALVREASSRVLGLRHFDEQLMGGIVLHQGGIAEMATGEGKTLAAILSAFLNALSGEGVCVVTVNDYLAARDAEWVGQPLRFLGMTVGVIQKGMDFEQRHQAYHCDVTYVTNEELGFDYLRDQMAATPHELRLREQEPFHYAIVDEVDSVLIDEARVPLVISEEAQEASEKYAQAKPIADSLQEAVDYSLEEKQKMCLLTDQGTEKAIQLLGITDLFDPEDPWAPFLVNALNAKEFYTKDKQYLVKDEKVIIVDEFTGRPMPGRRWNRGLHQAVEAKEGVPVLPEAITLASISYQNLFRQFVKLSGMTGTAVTEAQEFKSVYSLKVEAIPTHKPRLRQDEADQVYLTEEAKWRALVKQIEDAHEEGRPVLVGTTSVESSEFLGKRLDAVKVPYELLNAKPENIRREAEIIAGSGRKHSVTIATNMAGRGTDIILGGSASEMARLRVRQQLYPLLFPNEDSMPWMMPERFYPTTLDEKLLSSLQQAAETAAQAWASDNLTELVAGERLAQVCETNRMGNELDADAAFAGLRQAFESVQCRYQAVTEVERQEVVDLGGLCVMGTERHESRRIDNQLRGRAGRQGDPGTTRFFLSLTDNVFRVFGGDAIQAFADLGGNDGVAITSPLLSSALDEAQKRVEDYFAGARSQVFKYDEVLDQQRQVLYKLRRQALLETDEKLSSTVSKWVDKNMDEVMTELLNPDQPPSQWPLERLAKKLTAWYKGCGPEVTPETILEVSGSGGSAGIASLQAWAKEIGQAAVKKKEAIIDQYGPGLQHPVRRQVLLFQIDKFWVRHLQNMDYLKDSVKLRCYGGRDPLVDYKLEGYEIFLKMMAKIRQNAVYYLFLFKPKELQHVDAERLKAIAGDPEKDFADAGSSNASALQMMQQAIEARRPAGKDGDDVVVPFEDLCRESGSSSRSGRAAQLRWLASKTTPSGGVELLEDSFARACYVRIKASTNHTAQDGAAVDVASEDVAVAA